MDKLQEVDGISSLTSVTVSLDGKHVYTTSMGDDALAMFSRNASTGLLTYLGKTQDGIPHEAENEDLSDGPFHVTVSSDGKHVYMVDSGYHSLLMFSRNSSTGLLTYLGKMQDGVNGVDGLNNLYFVSVSLDGKHVYTAAYGDGGAVAMFKRDSSTGLLTYLGKMDDPQYGLESVTVSPDEANVYAASETILTMFERDPNTGLLTSLGQLQDGVDGVQGLGEKYVTVSTDGVHLYVGSEEDDSVAILERETICSGE